MASPGDRRAVRARVEDLVQVASSGALRSRADRTAVVYIGGAAVFEGFASDAMYKAAVFRDAIAEAVEAVVRERLAVAYDDIAKVLEDKLAEAGGRLKASDLDESIALFRRLKSMV